MRYLEKKDLLAIHREIEEKYGIEDTILHPSNLDAAVETPKMHLFGEELYPSVTKKAAVLMSRVCKFHPFLNGNNRTAFTSASMFLELNGRKLKESDEGVKLCRETSQCNIDVEELDKWFKVHSRRY
jgi:death-on-curing protein